MSDIFVSHIHEEETVANALLDFIKQALGTSTAVFLSSDSWQVFAGEVWLDRIKEELGSSKDVILLLSAESVRRPWVNFEAGAAWLTGKVLIPVCFAGITKGSLPKPYSNIQALDLEDEDYYLVRSLYRHLNPGSVPPPGVADFSRVRAAIRSLRMPQP